MRILEFIDKYCQDLVKESKENITFIDFTEFQYDEIITDEDGKRIPVVYVDTVPVPVRDFIEMHEDEFVYNHNTPNAKKVYNRYCSYLNIIEGEDYVMKLRKKIREATKKVEDETLLYGQI